MAALSAAQKIRIRCGRTVIRLRKAPLFALAILSAILFVAIFADLIMPHDPQAATLSEKLLPPFWQQGGKSTYPLGTDTLGRDLLSRIILGARISLAAALAAITLGGGIGTALGILSGYFGGWPDSLIMRAADAMISFPIILLALLLAVVMGPSFNVLIVVIGLALWARFARVVRGEVLSVRTRDFVSYAKVAGSPSRVIIFRHLLPNIMNTVIVMGTLEVGWVIIVEASLSFLGAGIPPPTPAWGTMVAEGRGHISTAWWISVAPGLAIAFAVMAFNLLGDWLRDTLDPKLRHTLL